MKKGLIFSVLIFAALISTAANRSLTIAPGYTQLNKFTLNASDTIHTSATVVYTITNLQKYMQHQVFTVALTTVSGSPSVTITAAGKVTSGGSWVTIGTPITWTTTGNNGSMASVDPINYNYLKVTFVASGATQLTKITGFEVKTSNAFDIPSNSGTLTVSRATTGTVTVTSKDDDANAATVYRAGGTGALTLGSTSGSTAITSNGTVTVTGNVAATSNLTNFATYSTDVDGRSIYGKATISSAFNATGPVIGAGVFGRVNGSSPTLTAGTAYLGGTFGYYGITGTVTNTHPKGGLIGVIGDGTTTADAAVVALLDGDTGTTTAGAAFGVRQTNSTGASGFSYGVDLYSAAIAGYLPVAYKTAEIRLSTGAVVKSGSATTRAGVRTAGGDAYPLGSMYISTGTGGKMYIKVASGNANTDWNLVTTSAAD